LFLDVGTVNFKGDELSGNYGDSFISIGYRYQKYEVTAFFAFQNSKPKAY
jgi:hypothetical protein